MCVNASEKQIIYSEDVVPKNWRNTMTEHILQEHAQEDREIMRRLALVVGCFVGFTAMLAIAVFIVAG
jgi:hypothetical protein